MQMCLLSKSLQDIPRIFCHTDTLKCEKADDLPLNKDISAITSSERHEKFIIIPLYHRSCIEASYSTSLLHLTVTPQDQTATLSSFIFSR